MQKIPQQKQGDFSTTDLNVMLRSLFLLRDFDFPASGSNSFRNLPTLYLVYISEGEKLHPVERLCPAGALMDSSSVGNLPVVSPQRFLIGAVRYGLLTLALPSSYTKISKKSSVLENFVLTGSVRGENQA